MATCEVCGREYRASRRETDGGSIVYTGSCSHCGAISKRDSMFGRARGGLRFLEHERSRDPWCDIEPEED
jgi:hypothetical protein